METNEIVGYLALAVVILLAISTRKKKDIRMPIVEDKIKLLPYWLKPIGIGTAILSFVGIVIKHSLDLNIDPHLFLLTLVISLLLIAISVEKEEDEMYRQLRQSAIYSSFFGSILTMLFIIAINFISGNESYFFSGHIVLKITLVELGIYLLEFRSLKKRMKELNSIEL